MSSKHSQSLPWDQLRHCTGCFCSSYPPWHPKPWHKSCIKPMFPKMGQEIALRRMIYSQVNQLSSSS